MSGSIVPTPDEDWATLKAMLPRQDRPARLLPTDFDLAYVPYVDGRIHFHEGNGAVLSGQYSGCLMAVYESDHQRRVAHVPKSHIVRNDCIGEFRDYFAAHSRLDGADKTRHAKDRHEFAHFFQPFVDSRDGEIQLELIGKLVRSGMIDRDYRFSVFGLVTAPENECISIWLVKPLRQPDRAEMWHVLLAAKRAPALDFKALSGKVNRAALAVMPE